ncbi:hypothetical protein LOAG_12787, partial [Loa loa]
MDDIWMQNGSNPNKILMMPSTTQSQPFPHPESHWRMYSVLNSGQFSGNFGRLSTNTNHNITTGLTYSQQTIASTSVSSSSSSPSTTTSVSLLSSPSHHHHHLHQQQQQNIHSSMITKRSESASSINDTMNTTTSTGETTIASAIKNMIKTESKSIDATIFANS